MALCQRTLNFLGFLQFLTNHLEAIFLLSGITVESIEGVATIKPCGKEQKPASQSSDASKDTKQLKMEKGTVTSLWMCLFSQASLERELT